MTSRFSQGLSPLEHAIEMLSRLPGFGPRSARRAVLYWMEHRETQLRPMLRLLTELSDRLTRCEICGNLEVVSPCPLCTDPSRDTRLICVVESVGDIWALERTAALRGRYHVLGGTLSAMEGIGPEQLRLPQLRDRVVKDGVEELILATGSTMEGQTTAYYIADMFQGMEVRVTRLSQGVPMGSALDFIDEGTLTTALAARRPIAMT